MTKKQIEKKVQECLDLVQSEIPVPIVKIANKLDLEVHEIHIPDDEEIGNVSSMLVHLDKKWLILLDQDLEPDLKRFAIAHSIGHHLLHPNTEHLDTPLIGDLVIDKNDNLEEEKEASYFALCLLIPALELKETWQDIKNIKDLANMFYVTPASMALRLQSLNLVEGIL